MPADPRRVPTEEAIKQLTNRGEAMVVARQSCTEYRGVATRPVAVNGLGMSPEEADAELNTIEGAFTLLPERDEVYTVWRDLCRKAGVSGKQVHDTRLVAVCVVAGVQTILTWNPDDFRRFLPFVPGLTVLTPDDVLSQPTS